MGRSESLMKILIIHASAGAGHMKAAEAIYNGLKAVNDYQVKLIDALDYTSPYFKKLYRQTYTFLVSKVPSAWGFFFGLLDIPSLQGFFRFIRRVYNSLNARSLEQFLKKEQFDYIVTTHFLSEEVVSSLKGRGKIKSKLVAVITDFDVHKIWVAKHVDSYAVASTWTKNKLRSLGIFERQIFVTGIPTDEKFSQNYDMKELKKKFNLKEDTFTVLMATGSFGFGPIEELIKALKGFQVIVVCGHNKDLYSRLTEKKYEGVKVCGLVDNMYEMMAVANVMVTKPGGLSISEALVSQLPMIFFNPIPGQETNNMKILAQHGIGASPRDIQDIVEEVKKLQSSQDMYLTLLKRTRLLAYPNAVKDIIKLIV